MVNLILQAKRGLKTSNAKTAIVTVAMRDNLNSDVSSVFKFYRFKFWRWQSIIGSVVWREYLYIHFVVNFEAKEKRFSVENELSLPDHLSLPTEYKKRKFRSVGEKTKQACPVIISLQAVELCVFCYLCFYGHPSW